MGDAADDAERRADNEHEEGDAAVAVVELDETPPHVQELAVRQERALIERSAYSVEDARVQRQLVEALMRDVMKNDVHYGVIPGTSKPTLLKPGAQLLCNVFRLAASYPTNRLSLTFHDDGHLTVVATCVLTHITSGLVMGEGVGLCTSREKRYALRKQDRVCPSCGEAAIKKSKFPPRANDYPGAEPTDPPGWYCHAKVGGCGANFAYDDPAITEQETGQAANPDLADTHNTVVKMATKRALLDAVLGVTAASDVFTQDLDADTSPSGVEGSDVNRENVQRPAARREDPQGPPIPRSWAELAERLSDLIGTDETAEWVRQAKEAFSGEGATLFQRCCGVYVDLAAIEGELQLRPDVRELVAGVFAKRFDGLILDGPPWVLTPDEAGTRLTKDEYETQQAAMDGAADEV